VRLVAALASPASASAAGTPGTLAASGRGEGWSNLRRGSGRGPRRSVVALAFDSAVAATGSRAGWSVVRPAASATSDAAAWAADSAVAALEPIG
jgi:hypothetical protein